jgi:hypothetical protein
VRTEDQIGNEIRILVEMSDENTARIKNAKAATPGSECADFIADRCTADNLAIRCRVDALNWVLGEG